MSCSSSRKITQRYLSPPWGCSLGGEGAGTFLFAESEYNRRHGVRQPKDGPVIDIECPACNTIYHADETCIGLEIRCRVCGRILRVERKGIATGRLNDVVQS